ncbi:MAG: hypothetical protein HY904_01910 [Deltaproteobacteria bacterium]|nr:hypothetical protein [Deltaproteobacteria bacterium]
MASKKKSFNIDALIAKLPAESRTREPSIPADTQLKEARLAATAAKTHRGRFAKLPEFDVAVVDSLPGIIAAYESAQKAWDRQRAAKALGKGKVAARAAGETLRSSILSAGTFLFRKQPAPLAELGRISEGEGLDDLITDLRDLVAHRTDNAARWAKDVKLPKNAFARCTELADLLDGTVESEEAISAHEHRNQVALVLEDALAELREGADYLFSDEPARLAPFVSRYNARKVARSRRKAAKAKGEATESHR